MSVLPSEFFQRLGATLTSGIAAVVVSYSLVRAILWGFRTFVTVEWSYAHGFPPVVLLILILVGGAGLLGFIAVYAVSRILFEQWMFDTTSFKRVTFDLIACLVVSSLVLAALWRAIAPTIQSLAF